jgi:hypothetical protein
MSTMLTFTLRYTAPAAYSLLPATWQSSAATAFVLAIGLHEGMGFTKRAQVPRKPGWRAPARSFYQFEIPGVKQVLTHLASARALDNMLRSLAYPAVMLPEDVLDAMTHNDTLAFGMARGLLRTVPSRLPLQHEGDEAYDQYLYGWKPNREAAAMHREDWPANYAMAWDTVLREAIDNAVRREGSES